MLPDCDKAIVLLHEIYGLNAHIKRTAATWRSRGYAVFTPALFPTLRLLLMTSRTRPGATFPITSDLIPPPLCRCWPSLERNTAR